MTGPHLVPYDRSGKLAAHIFRPEGWSTAGRHPVALVFSGGGFFMGSPEWVHDVAAALARVGLIGIAVQHRLVDPSTGVGLDALVDDAIQCLEWVRTEPDQGFDPDSVAVIGHSAGGYLAASTALLAPTPPPQAIVLWSAVLTLPPQVQSLLPDGAEPADWDPTARIRGGLPPALVVHGTSDDIISARGSESFAATYVAAGNDVELELIDGADHFFHATPHRRQALAALTDYAAAGLID